MKKQHLPTVKFLIASPAREAGVLVTFLTSKTNHWRKYIFNRHPD